MNKQYTVQVRVSLKDYPDVEPITSTVNCKIFNCRLTDLTAPEDLSQVYYIRTNELSVQFADFTQEPDCGYPIEYSFSDLPAWIESDSGDRSLALQSQDINDQGKYVINVIGSTPVEYPYEAVTASMTITVDAKFDCKQDEIVELKQIADQKIDLTDSGAPSILPTEFSQILESCPETFNLQKLSDLGWQSLSIFEQSIISIDASSNGEIVIGTDDRELDGEQWTLKFTVTSSAGVQSKSVEFDINFVDACWDATLFEAEFTQRSYNFVLYRDELKLSFSPMTVSMDCGGVFYELDYLSGPSGVASEIEILTQSSMLAADLDTREWLGSHQLRITGFNGLKDEDSPYGNQGVFNSIQSQTVTIKIEDPCKSTQIDTFSAGFPESIMVPLGQSQEIIELTGPKNSVSVLYGNGYNACGPVEYRILNEEGTETAKSTHFFLSS